MIPYNLFLDDIREPADCIFHKDDERYIDLKWTVVCSNEEFEKILEDKFQNGELPSLVSFDHDLDHKPYHEAMWKGIHAYENAYKSFTKKNINVLDLRKPINGRSIAVNARFRRNPRETYLPEKQQRVCHY